MSNVTITETVNQVNILDDENQTVEIIAAGPQGPSPALTIDDDSIVEAKLDIHADPSGTNKFLGYTSNGMEWAVPPDTNTTYTVGDNGLTENNFTDALKTKLDSVESNSTADMAGSEIKTAYESESDTNAFTDALKTKLEGIEASATGDQTNAEIRTAVEAASDSNVFTDADHTKLNGIESSATADQTGAEIKTAYEGESDTNAFTDAEKTKLSGISTSANNYVHPNHSGEVTSSADGATVIASNIVDEDNLKISNSPSNGTFLQYKDGTDELTWATPTDTNTTYTAGTGLNLSGTEFSVTSIALTTVQEAATESAQLSLTTQEGDVVVRTDENKTYVKNAGTAGTMADFTLLRTPTDAVLSVNGNTGAITAAQIASAVESASDSNTFTDAFKTKLSGIATGATNTAAPYYTSAISVGDGGLTQNNFTDTLKTKLDGIATGAEVNVQSDWNSSSGDSQILNKPTIPTNTDTTYSISCVDGDNTDEEKIRLTAGGSGSGTDDVVLEAGTGLSIARAGDKITFTNTVTDTNTQLTTEEVQDIIGAMVAGNTETNISVTYDDANGKLDFVSTDTNTTYSVVTSSANGLAPQLPGSHGGKFLKADGTWEVPPDTNTTYSVQDGQLSQNNFTNTLKTKLDGIAASANNYAISSDLLDEDDMSSNSATKVPSQQSVKAYVDANAGGGGDITAVTVTTGLAGGGTTGALVISPDTGITDSKLARIDDADAAASDYAKFTANGLEGRSYAEVKTDLSLDNVENTSTSTLLQNWSGNTSISSLGTVSTVTSTANNVGGVRKISASTSTPSGGADGDVWIKYTA